MTTPIYNIHYFRFNDILLLCEKENALIDLKYKKVAKLIISVLITCDKGNGLGGNHLDNFRHFEGEKTNLALNLRRKFSRRVD